MKDMHEKLRRFFEQVDASSSHAWEFWKRVPPLRVGDYVIEHTDKVIKSITTGEGDVRKNCIELAFILFALAEKHPEIMNETLPAIKSSTAKESQADTMDERAEKRERAEWHKKNNKKDDKKIDTESWRG